MAEYKKMVFENIRITNLDKNDIISIIKKAWYKASTQELDITKEKKISLQGI